MEVASKLGFTVPTNSASKIHKTKLVVKSWLEILAFEV